VYQKCLDIVDDLKQRLVEVLSDLGPTIISSLCSNFPEIVLLLVKNRLFSVLKLNVTEPLVSHASQL